MSTKTESKWAVGQDVVLLDHGRLGEAPSAYRCKVTKVGARDFTIDRHTQKFRLRDGLRPGSTFQTARVEPFDGEKHQPLLDATRASSLLNSLRYRDNVSAEQLLAALPHLEAAWRALGGKP